MSSSGLDDELEIFLKQNVVRPLALTKARKVCLDEDIDTVELLAELRDDNELKNIFTKGTASRICKGLSGQSCLILVTGVAVQLRLNYVPLRVLLRSYACTCRGASAVSRVLSATPPSAP